MEARETLQKVIRGDEPASALQPLLRRARLVPSVGDAGVDVPIDAESDSGAVRAVLAWDGLRLSSPGRLRACANTECRLFLIDR
ncbi:hypothetical protein C6A85_63180, partial [Mycobacterium sp. ITM-2017-0098]